MNLSHLKYFCDTARSGKLSDAAKRNRVTQPAVSQAIRCLETELNSKLIIHGRNRFELTSAGRAVLENSESVFRSLEQLRKAAVEEEHVEPSGTLRVGCTNSIASRFLPIFLAEFRQKYPRISPSVRLGNSESIKDWLHSADIDIGIAVRDGNWKEFNSQTLVRGNYLLVATRKTKLPQAQIIVSRTSRPEVRHILKLYQERYRSPLHIESEITSWSVIKTLVLAGGIAGILPDYIIQNELDNGELKAQALGKDLPTYQLEIFSARRRVLPNTATLFQSFILQRRGPAAVGHLTRVERGTS